MATRSLAAAVLLSASASAAAAPVPCCPPFGPPMPAPFPAKYAARFATQPVSHFNYLQPTDPATNATATFQQLYLVYDAHWAGPPAPIVFYTGAEGTGVEAIWPHSGWVVDTLAQNLSALVIFAEHRFFGLSVPGGEPGGFAVDATHLGVLSEAEALEDFAALATQLRTNLSAWDSPLISVGGSLAGELTAWFRIRYSHLVDMGIAASAPIFGYPGLADPYGWNRVATDCFRSLGGDACVENVRSGYWQTSALSAAEVTAAFNTCTPASLPCHAQQVADLVADWAGGAAESSYPPTADRSAVLHGCVAMQNATSGLQAYQQLLAPQEPGQCLNISWFWECPTSSRSSGGGAPRAPRRPGQLRRPRPAATKPRRDGDYEGWCLQHLDSALCQDGWTFQSCTTEIHPIAANNVTDFFPPFPPEKDDRLASCRNLYGGNISLDAQAMPRAFGQLDEARMAASASRIIFSSGSYDPWSAQSVNRSLSASLPFVLIDQGAHHSDLGESANPVPDPQRDTPALVAAREFEIETLRGWIADFHKERRAAKARLAANERHHFV